MSPQERLEQKLKKLFVKAFATYGLLSDDDRVLVGLSGGKDSLFLVEMLAKRALITHPRYSVEAVHVRMENVHYETSTDYLTDFCRELNVPLHIVSTSFDVDDADIETSSVEVRKRLRRQKSPCFLCSWNRRKMMFNLAQELGCNKIALGHHQDDIINTALMNLTFQGRFDTMPALLKMRKMPLSIIRPLCMMEERDIAQYAEWHGYQKQVKLCPYETDSHRNGIRQLYAMAESMNPDARHSIWNALNSEGKLVGDY